MKSHLLIFILFILFGGKLLGQNSNFELGNEYFEKKEYKKALAEFSDCQESMNCLVMQSLTYMRLRKFDKAKNGYLEVLTRPGSSSFLYIYYNLALCEYNLEQYDSSIYYQRQEINSDNFDLTPNHHLITYFYFAKAFYAIEQYDSSTVYLEKCLTYDSLDLDCTYLLCKSHWFAGNQKASFKIIDNTLSRFPDDISFLTLRGFFMFDANIEGSLEYYEEAMELGWKPKGIEKKVIRLLSKQKKKRN